MSSDPEKITKLSNLISSTADSIIAAANNMKTERDAIVAAVDTVAPSQVTGLVATTISANQINLSWNTVPESDLNHYDVVRNGSKVSSPVTNGFNDTALSAGTTYSYSVRAIDNAGNAGVASAIVQATTSPGPTPTPTPTPTPYDFTLPAATKTTNVSSLSALVSAVANAQKDEYVVLADGTYNNSSSTTLRNNNNNRVVIRAANISKAIITGQPISLGTPDLILVGFDLQFSKSGDYMVLDGNRNRLTRNKLHFGNVSDGKWVSIAGSDVMIDHNEVFNKTTMDNMICDRDTSALRPKILFNYFHDMIGSGTPMECMRIGESGEHNIDFNGEVAWNRFEKISADTELCTWKCTNLNVHHNTMVDCNSAHTFRHGALKKFNDNICINSGGLRFYGKGNEVKRNQIINSNRGQLKGPLTIGSGSSETDTGGASYARVRDNTIENNIMVGSSQSSIYLGYGDKGFPPLNNSIKNNIVVATDGKATQKGSQSNWADQQLGGNIFQLSGAAAVGDMPSSGYTKTDAKLVKKVDGTYDFASDSPLKWTQTVKYLRPEDVGINAP